MESTYPQEAIPIQINKQMETEQIKELNTNQNESIEVNHQKIKLPKRKYAIIHGYNGHNYFGNQK